MSNLRAAEFLRKAADALTSDASKTESSGLAQQALTGISRSETSGLSCPGSSGLGLSHSGTSEHSCLESSGLGLSRPGTSGHSLPESSGLSCRASSGLFNRESSELSRPESSGLASKIRSIFAPYSRKSNMSSRSGPQWAHRFCALASTNQVHAPSKEEKMILLKAGLGERKITFSYLNRKNSSPDIFKKTVLETFPKLLCGGGFEILRTSPGSRQHLSTLWVPPGGLTTSHLADESGLGQAVCYVRPIQRDLSLESLKNEDGSANDVTEECLNCGLNISMSQMRHHMEECGLHVAEGCTAAEEISIEEDDAEIPPIQSHKRKRTKLQVPVCQYVCSEKGTPPKQDGLCPVCGISYPYDILLSHASSCGDLEPECSADIQVEGTRTNLQECLEAVLSQTEGAWPVSVLRRRFNTTAMEQLEDASDADWMRKIKVDFIGEEGIDEGGLTREFFSLLFRLSSCFEGNTFSFTSEFLKKCHYRLMGKCVAYALAIGHPGPRRLQTNVVDYILQQKKTSFSEAIIASKEMEQVINEILGATETSGFQQICENHGNVLQAAGVNTVVNGSNKELVITSLREYHLLYRCLGSIHQFMEGLKLHNVLCTLQKFPEKAKCLLVEGGKPDVSEIKAFFRASFSSQAEEKEMEEQIVYNFMSFLTKVANGKVTTQWIELDTLDERDVVLTPEHVLQAFLGCPQLPHFVTGGLLLFDHAVTCLTTVNTCIPSITFCNTGKLQDFDYFKKIMLNIIVDSYGFGKV